MRATTKTVYYCDHCRKHGLSRVAMEKHERVCTLNPERICRWRIDGHSDGSKVIAIVPLATELAARAAATERGMLAQEDIAWLRDEVDGCPACMLAALRQSGLAGFHWDAHGDLIFDYTVEVERLRIEEREDDHAADYRYE